MYLLYPNSALSFLVKITYSNFFFFLRKGSNEKSFRGMELSNVNRTTTTYCKHTVIYTNVKMLGSKDRCPENLDILLILLSLFVFKSSGTSNI
jgi:hypothetical protein